MLCLAISDTSSCLHVSLVFPNALPFTFQFSFFTTLYVTRTDTNTPVADRLFLDVGTDTAPGLGNIIIRNTLRLQVTDNLKIYRLLPYDYCTFWVVTRFDENSQRSAGVCANFLRQELYKMHF